MRQAGVIADRAMGVGLNAVEPGVRECDVAAKITYEQVRGTEDFGGDIPMQLLLEAGERAKGPHLIFTEKPFKPNESTGIELGGCRHRYHVGLSRSIYLGKPPAELKNLSDVVLEGMEVTLAAVAPGKTCEEIEAVWRGFLSKAGYEKSSRIGYSIGVGYPPCWLEYSASIREGDRTVLQPNMTFHLILGMWLGSVNFLISETFHVTANGHEALSKFPRKLFTRE